MHKKTTRVISDSHLPDEAAPTPRKDRKYTLSRLGIKAAKWLKGEPLGVNADFCCGCLRVVSKCRCDGR